MFFSLPFSRCMEFLMHILYMHLQLTTASLIKALGQVSVAQTILAVFNLQIFAEGTQRMQCLVSSGLSIETTMEHRSSLRHDGTPQVSSWEGRGCQNFANSSSGAILQRP